MEREAKKITICPNCGKLLDVVSEVYEGRAIYKLNSEGLFDIVKADDDVYLECGYCGKKLPETISIDIETLLPKLVK